MIAGILATEGYKVTDVATARAAAGALTKRSLNPSWSLPLVTISQWRPSSKSCTGKTPIFD